MRVSELVLVDTSPPGRPGSMGRYADLVWQCAQGPRGLPPVTRLRLALPYGVLACFSPRWRTWVHHAWLLAGRGRLSRGATVVYHVLDGSHAYVADRLPGNRCIVTCHDLIPLLQLRKRLPGTPGPAAVRIIERSARALQRTGLVMAVSENTQRDVEVLLGVSRDRCCVVPHALPLGWGMSPGHECGRQAPEAHVRPIMLHIGNNAPYKNREGVVRVFAKVRGEMDARLVLAGAGRDALTGRIARELGVDSDIQWVQSPSDRRVEALYREARLLLFPSLYEGFGWPVLEAMAVGCPVVASTAGSLPEVAGTAALLAGAHDEAGLAGACLRILRDPECASRLAAQGRARAAEFTLERMAEGLMSAYARVGENRLTSV